MHQAVAAFHLSRRAGKPLSEEDLLAVFARAWSPEGFLSRQHEEKRYAGGQAALKRFRSEQLAHDDNVVAVERPFAVNLDGINVRGRIDRLDRTESGASIIDYKSSDVRDPAKADARARESLQLQVYALAYEAEHGVLPASVKLHFLDTGVEGSAAPDPKRLARARDKLKTAALGIREARFEPKPDAISCGYCPYRQVCASSAA
jgi:DNA helicase-2/ATP-dependent DNA helicase PcrA